MQDFAFKTLVERVKLRAPIEAVVGDRVGDLRQRGSLWWARCPFHEERTPSFAVDPRKGTWRCYGACGEGGDALSFLQRFDGLDFLDALRLLARETGEPIDEEALGRRHRDGGEARKGRERRLEVLRWAAGRYASSYASALGDDARAYLQGRGLLPETCEAFGVGWAPADGNPLLGRAERDGYSSQLLIETGLAKRSPEGRVYDFFRGRILLPIRDRLGHVVGFGGRVLVQGSDDRPVAKYVNTPETALFKKGELIFGLDLALGALRKTRRVVLVEGYTDVMAAHQAGWTNTVAVLGTATTRDHGALVRRSGAQTVVLAFDGDAAGRQASRKALLGLLPQELEVRIARLRAGADPGELLVTAEGRAEFEAAVEAAQDWFQDQLVDLEGLTGSTLARAVDELFALVIELKQPVARSARLSELSRHLGLPDADVRLQWQAFVEVRERQARRASLAPREAMASGTRGAAGEDPRFAGLDDSAGPEPVRGPNRRPDQGVACRTEERAFELLLGAFLLDNSLIGLYRHLVARSPEGELARLYQRLLELYDEGEVEVIDAVALMEALGDDPLRDRVVRLEGLAEQADDLSALAEDQERWLERRQREAETRRLSTELERTQRTLEASDASDEVLKRLHATLREGRVPHGASAHRP